MPAYLKQMGAVGTSPVAASDQRFAYRPLQGSRTPFPVTPRSPGQQNTRGVESKDI